MTSSEIFSVKNFNFLLIGFLSLMILPFLILSFYSNPTPEDFAWSEPVRSWGFFEAQKFFYNVWSGRFFSYALLSINPLLFKSIPAYKFLIFLITIVFVVILYFFISEMTGKRLKIYEKILITLSIFFLFVYSMPSVSEGLFWMTAALTYNTGIFLILIFYILTNRLQKAETASEKYFYLSVSCLTLVALAGTSELAGILMLVLLVTRIFNRYFDKKKQDLKLIFFLILLTVALAFSFLSPGNFYKSGQIQDKYNIFYSLNYSFTFILKNYITWIFKSPLLIISFMLMPVLLKLFRDPQNIPGWIKVKPAYALTGLITLPFIIIFFFVLSTGDNPYSRIKNFSYFVFLMFWFYTLAVLLFHYKDKINLRSKIFSKYVYAVAALIFVVLMIRKNNVRTAYSELWHGSASAYNNEFNMRYDLIQKSAADSCEVPAILYVPKSFFLIDITKDPGNLYNQWYSQYFDKKSIVIRDKGK